MGTSEMYESFSARTNGIESLSIRSEMRILPRNFRNNWDNCKNCQPILRMMGNPFFYDFK
ncbi:hypothetical protein [Daejeonella sp.]|uniref:hypothetical protein n=1 Tax=Daejeonella sp. TaxID=2805397 RepID=UPI00352201F1